MNITCKAQLSLLENPLLSARRHFGRLLLADPHPRDAKIPHWDLANTCSETPGLRTG